MINYDYLTMDEVLADYEKHGWLFIADGDCKSVTLDREDEE